MKRKSRKITRRKKAQTKKNGVWKIFSMFVFAFLAVISLATYQLITNSSRAGLKIASNGPRNSLQLETFYITPTPKPPPVDVCNHVEDGHEVPANCICPFYLIRCENKQCVEFDSGHSQAKDRAGHPFSCADTHPPAWSFNWCDYPATATKDGWFCLDKPVIYLYPTHPMLIDVSVETPGKVVVSIPLYPEGGWKNVYARPNGKLTYQGKPYTELFYESSVTDFEKPTTGITLEKEKIKEQLDSIVTKLGLIKNEKQEFLDYWVSRLNDLNSPYILFSIIEKSEKEKIDHLVYSIEPDTRIEFIAYFKPLLKPFEGKPLDLPSTPPQRIGFTAVEWGGTIDR